MSRRNARPVLQGCQGTRLRFCRPDSAESQKFYAVNVKFRGLKAYMRTSTLAVVRIALAKPRLAGRGKSGPERCTPTHDCPSRSTSEPRADGSGHVGSSGGPHRAREP